MRRAGHMRIVFPAGGVGAYGDTGPAAQVQPGDYVAVRVGAHTTYTIHTLVARCVIVIVVRWMHVTWVYSVRGCMCSAISYLSDIYLAAKLISLQTEPLRSAEKASLCT